MHTIEKIAWSAGATALGVYLFRKLPFLTFSTYVNTGPFTDSAAPGLSAAYNNKIETFLDQIKSSIVNDINVSADGSGKVTVKTIQLTLGTITRIALFSSTGTGAAQNISHGLGASPDFITLNYAGNFGGPPTQVPYWYNQTSTTVQVVAQNAFFYYGLAIKF